MVANPLLFIAEAGVNHNGSEDLAREMIDAAAAAGADIVKFQTAIPEEVVSVHAEKAAYQKITTGACESQLEMVRKLHFNTGRNSIYQRLITHADSRGIRLLSSPFDIPSLHFLVGDLGLTVIKIASGEVTNAPLLLAAARSDCNIILSTGMATLADIKAALGVLAFGYLEKTDRPSVSAFDTAFASDEGQACLRAKVTLLHCVTSYPAPTDETNLRAMDTLRDHFALPTGFSDHSLGLTIPIAAAARGACLIEKHFTLDRSLPGPDHAASLEPQELAALVRAVRDVETALGSGIKEPQACEIDTARVARRSLVARKPIRAGEQFNEINLTAKRPAGGISPMRYWEIVGKSAPRDFLQDEIIDEVP